MKPHLLIDRLVQRGGGYLPVAKAMGSPSFQGTLHKIAKGQVRTPERDSALRIARHFKIPVEAVYDESVAAHIWALMDEDPHAPENGVLLSTEEHRALTVPLVAQSMSDLSPITLPTMPWEAVMKGDALPEVFILAAPDDALAPEIRAGAEVIWSTTKRAKFGDPVLVRDRDGRTHLRKLHEGSEANQFIAAPVRDGYRKLYSDKDGLSIIAVWHGELGDYSSRR